MSTHRKKKLTLECTLAIAGLAAIAPVVSQAQESNPELIESFVITGSRIVRDGFEAPTPVTVMGAEEFQASGTVNVADILNTSPAFAGSTMPTATNSTMSSGASGLNSLNLRSLGQERTLVLLDGRRAVASRPTGIIDVNTFPQQLIERVEVVTGGASAAYGADAVAGVVNFILDKDFEGFKSDAAGGRTTYGDNDSWDFSATFGTSFANGRGHFLISGNMSEEAGVPVNDRPWNQEGWNLVVNPAYTATNGQPEYLVRNQVAPATGIVGGIITDTALRGVAFGEGGTPYMFPYGPIVSDPVMIGGGWQSASIRGKDSAPGLTSSQNTDNIFARVSFDLSDSTNVWAEYSLSGNENQNWCCLREDTANLKISTDNAFLPQVVADQAAALGITTFTMGSMNYDLGRSGAYNNRKVERFTAGIEGDFDSFGTNWVWDAYVQRGEARAHQEVFNVVRRSRYTNALDSVRSPVTGLPVCRINVDSNPNNDDPLCMPYNIFGIGVNSPQTIDYILGSGARDMRVETLVQDVFAASVSGSPFETWAGPISLAAGFEYRSNEVSGVNDDISRNLADWFYGNYRVYDASSDVAEVFLEGVVPLADGLELNAAVRATDYEHSGEVTTWKTGITWAFIDDVSFRGTVSRDIRAPSLEDMFAKGSNSYPGIVNPFRGGISENTISSTSGNPHLDPEESDYYGFGFVFHPEILPGFTASVDYWNIDINGAIETTSVQNIINFCHDGKMDFCDALDFGSNQEINLIRTIPFNMRQMQSNGVDIEARYSFAPGDIISGIPGDMTISYHASHVMEKSTISATGAKEEFQGVNRDNNGVPDWRWRTTLSYKLPRFTGSLTARGISDGVYNNYWIECTNNCPTSTTLARTIDNNKIDGAIWLDGAFSFDISPNNDGSTEVYFNVRNMFDKDPSVVAPGPGGYSYEAAPANANLYDTLGRVYRLGFRVSL